MRVYIEDKYYALPAGSSMAEFSPKQLEQLNEIFGTPLNKLSQRVGELSQQIGAVNERQIRQEDDTQNHHPPGNLSYNILRPLYRLDNNLPTLSTLSQTGTNRPSHPVIRSPAMDLARERPT